MDKPSLTYQYLLDKYGPTISFQDAGEELGVYWENLRRLCKTGDIRANKVGRKWLLTTKALADYIDHGPAPQAPAPKEKRRRVLSL